MPIPFRSRDRRTRRLTAIREEITRLQAQIAVLDEQIVHQAQVEADAQTDAVVAGHDAAAREHRSARSDLERTRRQRRETAERIDRLRAEQDTLLEEMLD